MKTYKDFSQVLESFFMDYLIKERGISGNTIRSYRDTFVKFIDYMSQVHHTSPDKIKLESLTKDMVSSFLDWLESSNNASISTRNQRYAALRSFFKYMMYEDPMHLAQWKLAASMKNKKCTSNTMSYLSTEGISLLLKQVNTSIPEGRRDFTLLSLLYNTGARVSELTALTPSSIRLTKPYVVELYGKGSKKRIVPIDENVMELAKQYMEEKHLLGPGKSHYPLFHNVWGERLTTPGISYIIRKYAASARAISPELIPERISPHVFRHSRAMHLLQAGVNLVYIRDILGHVSIQTTEIYARADSKYKREALEKAYLDVGVIEPEVKSWEKDEKLKAFLKGLA